MARNIDNVEIKEPPIQELKKNRSCFKRSCFTGCLAFVVLFLLFWGLLKFAATPRVKQLKDIPETIPASIPIYDEDSIETITVLSAKEKNRALELLAMLPKIVVVPLYMSAEEYLPKEVQEAFDDGTDAVGWDRFVHLVRQPLFGKDDVVEITWRDLAAEPSFVLAFYEKELEKAYVDVTVTNGIDKGLTFATGTLSGTLTIDDARSSNGTDRAVLSISVSPQE